MKWRRHADYTYADGAAHRYYVDKRGTGWTLRVCALEHVAGVAVVALDVPAVATESGFDRRGDAYDVAACFEQEPERGTQRRMTRALGSWMRAHHA